MKTKIAYLFLLGLLTVACSKQPNQSQTIPLSDINADFPVAEKIEYHPIQKFDIYTSGGIDIKDSILWLTYIEAPIVGHAYNLYTGEQIAPIAASGRALNEIEYGWEKYEITNDSIFFMFNSVGMVKGFALKDILNNQPMGERKAVIQTVPDSIRISKLDKLPDGSVLISIQSFSHIKTRTQGMKEQSFAYYDGKNLTGFQPYPFDRLNLSTNCDDEQLLQDVLKLAFTQGNISFKNNNEFAGTVSDQFIVYTFNKEEGKIMHLKQYTTIVYQTDSGANSYNYITDNERHISLSSVQTDNQYIVCMGSGYFTQEEAEAKKAKIALFVFDWNLNPIKRIDIKKQKQNENNIMMYKVDLDQRRIYCIESGKEGLSIYEADLNL